jgi:hypothetical protein
MASRYTGFQRVRLTDPEHSGNRKGYRVSYAGMDGASNHFGSSYLLERARASKVPGATDYDYTVITISERRYSGNSFIFPRKALPHNLYRENVSSAIWERVGNGRC